MIGDKNDAYRPEYIWATSPTGPPQKGLPGPFPGAPERIRIKFVALLYQITHDLIMINRELDPKAQALRIEVNRKGVWVDVIPKTTRRTDQIALPESEKRGGKCAKPTLYLPRT